MSGLRRLYRLGAIAIGLLAAATAAAQNLTVGGQDVDVFFAVASGNKKIKVVPASSISPGGQVVIPPGVASGLGQPGRAKIRYRRNKCTHRKEILIVPPGTTPEQIAEEEKSKGQDCGAFLLLPQDVPWGSGTNVTIDYSADVPTVTTSVAQTSGAATLGTAAATATHPGVGWDLGVYSGGEILREDDQGGSAYNFQFDLAYLFPVSPRDSVGFEVGAQYLQTTPVVKLGGMPPPMGTATFSDTWTGMRNFSFGGRFEKTFSRFGFDVEAGPLVANVESRTTSGFCFHGTLPGVTCMTNSITSTHANGFGAYLGTQAYYRLSNRISVVTGFTYDRTYPGRQADVHALVFDAGFRFHFP